MSTGDWACSGSMAGRKWPDFGKRDLRVVDSNLLTRLDEVPMPLVSEMTLTPPVLARG